MSARIDLRHFGLANPIYAAARVSIFEVNGDFQRTDRLAPIYPSLTGMGLLANPQTLDSEGKWQQPIYVDRPVVLVVEGGASVGSHETGVTGIIGGWRADWQAGATYAVDDIVRDGLAGSGTTNLYISREYHTSGPVWSADLGAGRWEIYVDAQGVASSVVAQSEAAAIAAANSTVDARIAEIAAGAGNVPTPAIEDIGRFLRANATEVGGPANPVPWSLNGGGAWSLNGGGTWSLIPNTSGSAAFDWAAVSINEIGDMTPIGRLVAAATDQAAGRSAISAASASGLAQEILDRIAGDAAAVAAAVGFEQIHEQVLATTASTMVVPVSTTFSTVEFDIITPSPAVDAPRVEFSFDSGVTWESAGTFAHFWGHDSGAARALPQNNVGPVQLTIANPVGGAYRMTGFLDVRNALTPSRFIHGAYMIFLTSSAYLGSYDIRMSQMRAAAGAITHMRFSFSGSSQFLAGSTIRVLRRKSA
jgi:hypothetical protein